MIQNSSVASCVPSSLLPRGGIVTAQMDAEDKPCCLLEKITCLCLSKGGGVARKLASQDFAIRGFILRSWRNASHGGDYRNCVNSPYRKDVNLS